MMRRLPFFINPSPILIPAVHRGESIFTNNYTLIAILFYGSSGRSEYSNIPFFIIQALENSIPHRPFPFLSFLQYVLRSKKTNISLSNNNHTFLHTLSGCRSFPTVRIFLYPGMYQGYMHTLDHVCLSRLSVIRLLAWCCLSEH